MGCRQLILTNQEESWVPSECRHGHISAPVLFEWGYNESCRERQAIGTFDNCWDESGLFSTLTERYKGLSPEGRHSNISALWMGFQWILLMVTREIRKGGSWKWWGHGDRFGLKKMITLQIEEDLLLQTISLINWTIFTNLFSNSLVTHSKV